MKKQKITKYEKRLMMTNIYHHVLIEYNKPKNIYYGYDELASEYLYTHLPSCATYALVRVTWRWIVTAFNNDNCHMLYRNPLDVINKCKEYGINLDDIKNLQGYIN